MDGDLTRDSIALPAVPVVVPGLDGITILDADGALETLSPADARARLDGETPLVCHWRAAARRLGVDTLSAFDVLELFAFVLPARFCVPSPRGLAMALDLPPPAGAEDGCLTLRRAAEALLRQLSEPNRPESSDPVAIAWSMAEAWPWTPAVLRALNAPNGPASSGPGRSGLEVWQGLTEWKDEAPPAPPGSAPLDPAAVQERLQDLVAQLGPDKMAEARPSQRAYADAARFAFAPRDMPERPNMVLAEAGTGIGKTLGYLAAATLWAETNGAPVWISTYTKNLQRQIDSELAGLYPEPTTRARKVVQRKGRENYLCLLNLEDAVNARSTAPQTKVGLGLMARWAAASRDGDLVGGDLPGWLVELLGRRLTHGLADRRGECIYSACAHYRRCFIERSIRRARKADIVIANHALVMLRAARASLDLEADDRDIPGRYVLDEGHHIFDAADSAFSVALTGLETAELRRWLIGAETRSRSRARGLKARLDGLLGEDPSAIDALETLSAAARALPAEGWHRRLGDNNPAGPAEEFLSVLRRQVYARTNHQGNPFSLEAETTPPVDGLVEAAHGFDHALAQLHRPIEALIARLRARLEDEAEELDTDSRRRLDAAARALTRRGAQQIAAWRAMLGQLPAPPPEGFVDWFGVERIDGHDRDIGYFRHWVDPTVPLAATLAPQAHGVLITSATLKDQGTQEGPADTHEGWQTALERTGALHLREAGEWDAPSQQLADFASPFDYPAQSRVLVVNDVRKDDLDQVASAYRSLFLAAGGGGLGLFTAVHRLRSVHQRLSPALAQVGLPLYAQHIDGMGIGSLIDIFRAEPESCLLGTDAVRDGVDVPGAALRLIVFDRVPWPRPSLLNKARGAHFGKQRYTDMLTRLKLKQAYGRLIRSAGDLGVFVLLDPMMPSRLCTAFPPGVEVVRTGLAEAVEAVRSFLKPPPG